MGKRKGLISVYGRRNDAGWGWSCCLRDVLLDELMSLMDGGWSYCIGNVPLVWLWHLLVT